MVKLDFTESLYKSILRDFARPEKEFQEPGMDQSRLHGVEIHGSDFALDVVDGDLLDQPHPHGVVGVLVQNDIVHTREEDLVGAGGSLEVRRGVWVSEWLPPFH